MKAILDGLKENRVVTYPQSPDPRLRGRTYAIPFEKVWQGLLGLGGGGLKGWVIESADDQHGLIRATVRGGALRPEIAVRIDVGLDENGQTRVDLIAATRTEGAALGRSRRVIGSFTQNLDRKLGAEDHDVLDPTRLTVYETGT